MTTSNQADEALVRMRAANPVSAEELRKAIGEPELIRAMGRAIALGDSRVEPSSRADHLAGERAAPGGSERNKPLSRRGLATASATVACVAAIAILLLLAGGPVDSVKNGGRPVYAAAAVEVAESNPRLLITAPGWSIVHANGFLPRYGGLTYRRAGHPAFGPDGTSVVMSWAPAALYRSALRESRRNATVRTSTILGRHATIFEYGGRSAYVAILPAQGGVFVTLSLPAGEHEALLRSLRAVSVERWLGAMPPEVVQPSAEFAVVEEMLRGVPLPPGIDTTSLRATAEPTSRYELGRTVSGTAACGWLESWEAATRSGDSARARAAVAAMRSARRWPVLLQMVHEKGYRGATLPAHGNGWPSYIVTAAREIAAGHLRRRPAVRIHRAHGVVVGVQTPRDAAPASVLGCSLSG